MREGKPDLLLPGFGEAVSGRNLNTGVGPAPVKAAPRGRSMGDALAGFKFAFALSR